MLTVSIPNDNISERKYIIEVILNDFLGVDYIVKIGSENFEIFNSESSKKLIVSDVFFGKTRQSWLQHDSMPALPLLNWYPSDDNLDVNLIDRFVPILYGGPGIVREKNQWTLNIDIFGSSFFMLSRYEELVVQDRDTHNRFPAISSIAYKANFLERPIVNEYLEILWSCMHQLWPSLKRKERGFRKLISCDVDHPYDQVSLNFVKTLKRIGARLVRDKEPKLAALDGLNYIAKKFNSDMFDSYRNNIDWIMKVNSKHGNKVVFNFIPMQSNPNYDDKISLDNFKIKLLLKSINDNEHEIGFHPGYDTYDNKVVFEQSLNELKDTLHSLNIPINNLGGRQHYLRYDISKTPNLWNDNGLIYDSSLAYADVTGFRSGVCFEYRMYDLVNRKPLKLTQRPLVVMDYPIIYDECLGYSSSSLKRFLYFKKICKKFNGDFTLLWHNSFFVHELDKKFYLELIKD